MWQIVVVRYIHFRATKILWATQNVDPVEKTADNIRRSEVKKKKINKKQVGIYIYIYTYSLIFMILRKSDLTSRITFCPLFRPAVKYLINVYALLYPQYL